jgi:pimeloyl-ACP methyl ester carboxylesterase
MPDTMPAAPRDEPVVSADGTRIDVRCVGEGPGVVVVPGALSTAADYERLTSALSQQFTVHTIQRRGRGRSGPQGDRYSIDRECEDLEAVVARTGARYLFGHSYGGLIVLRAAARPGNRYERVAVYEPGVSVDGLIPMHWMSRYRSALERDRPIEALAALSVATGPLHARRLPVGVMRLLLLALLPPRRRRAMAPLLEPALREHEQILQLDNATADYRAVTAPTLLLSGARSRLPYVPAAVAALTSVMPDVRAIELPGLDHFGPDGAGAGRIAGILTDFFLFGDERLAVATESR